MGKERVDGERCRQVASSWGKASTWKVCLKLADVVSIIRQKRKERYRTCGGIGWGGGWVGISIKRHQHSGWVLWAQERQHDHLQGRQAAAVRQRGCWASFTKCYDRKLRVLANTQPEGSSLHSFTNDVTLRKWLEWGDWESQRLKWKSEMKDSLRNQGELRKTSKGNPAVVFRTRKFLIQCISLPVFWA